jgi:hypothetical protein
MCGSKIVLVKDIAQQKRTETSGTDGVLIKGLSVLGVQHIEIQSQDEADCGGQHIPTLFIQGLFWAALLIFVIVMTYRTTTQKVAGCWRR